MSNESNNEILPSNWRKVQLGEVCSVDWGNTSITKASYVKDGFPAYSAKGQDGFLDFYEHDANSLIVSAIGARCGKCFYASGKWTAIKNTIVVKDKSGRVSENFLFYQLDDENKWSRSGSGQPFISIGKAKLIEIKLPPLPEQKAIAKVLRSVQEAKEARQIELYLERERKNALMDYLFTHGTRGESLKQTEIGEMPESWEVVKLKDVCLKTKSVNPTQKPDDYFTYIDISCVSNQSFKIVDSSNLIGVNAPSRARKLIETDDIIFATVRPTMKRIAMISEQYDGQVCSTGFCVVKANQKVLEPTFAFYCLLADRIEKITEQIQKGASYPAISDSDLLNQNIPFPTLDEQREIAEVLQACDEKISALENEINLLDEFFKAMLEELMSGNLRTLSLC